MRTHMSAYKKFYWRFYGMILWFVITAPSLMLAAQTPNAIPTFECIGLYWKPDAGAENKICQVNYREAGTKNWREALPLWFDKRNHKVPLLSTS